MIKDSGKRRIDITFWILLTSLVFGVLTSLYLFGYGTSENHKAEDFTASINLKEIVDDNGETAFHFNYILQNNTDKKQTFRFNSGQMFDGIVKDSNGNKIKQLSEGLMHTMSLSEETIMPNDKMTHKAIVTGLEKGTYEIEMWLTPRGEDKTYNQTYTFEVK